MPRRSNASRPTASRNRPPYPEPARPPVPPAVYTISIPSSTRRLEEVRRFVERHARAANLNETTVEHFKIAVDEACTNVIKHAYQGADNRTIDIALIVRPDRFTVSIRDNGRAFDPQCYRTPDIMASVRERRAGGFGVLIIQRLMDHVEYRTEGAVNEVLMTKYRTPQPEPVPPPSPGLR